MRKIILLIILLYGFSGFAQNEAIDSLSVQLAFRQADTTKVDLSIKLVNELYDKKDYDLALKYISQTEKLATDLNYKSGLAKIAYLKALNYIKKEDYLNAINHFSEAKSRFSLLHDTLAISRINNQIGLIEISRGHYDKGLQHTLSAIQELEKRNLTSELKDTYKALTKAYLVNRKYDKAISNSLKLLEIEQKLGSTTDLIDVNKNLGLLYGLELEHKKSIDYYEKALSLNTETNDSLLAFILPKLGYEYIQYREYEKAGQYLAKSLKLNRQTNNRTALIETLNATGELNLRLNKTNLAEHQLLEAYTLLRDDQNKTAELKNYDLLKTVDSLQRDYQRALMWQQKFYTLKDSLHRLQQISINETKDNIESLNTFDSPEYTISQTDVKPSYAGLGMSGDDQQEFNKLRIISYSLFAAFAIVTTFLVLTYLNRNRRLKYTHDLEEKNKKIELQNKAILEQSAHLESINHVKDRLFSIVSHDLKDSLTSINGFIDLLKEGSLSRQEFDKLIPELSENASNASLLLFNLLNWSKSQMESLEPNASIFNIREVVLDKVKLLEHKLSDKNITLIDNTLKDFVYADQSMIEIVIQNLLTNAIKFSKSGDTITITNKISNGNSIISISDTGIGISKSNIDKLFKNNSYTTVGTKNEKGTGLGLSICKELVDLNQGKIWVESMEHVGSTFYVQLPKSKID
ncbi:tetratricopeptide repeat-containing sensor histidine kinase [Formosa sp. S-31]|uniref:tetratricopeptide repeat-containing sensor histidine kinase n=1 Tax=Formosa sp. S-31 TaxID=2790949 RepID=UPI003EBDFFDC